MLIRPIHIFVAALLALPGVAGAAGVVQLPATNQTTCFNENGTARPCAGTGEDGEKRAGVAWPATRFTDNNNGTVSDNLTGLTWSKHANAPSRALPGAAISGCQVAESDMLWPDALAFIACLNTRNHAGFSDWRLPNLNELESMINSGEADTSTWLNANGFGFGAGLPSEVQPSQYWTSTSDASATDLPDLSAAAAWEMDLVKGDFPFSILKNGKTNAVWPVRGVSNGPAKIWRTGQTLCFDDLGDTRPCAGSGEDGEKLAGAALPVPRFTANTGATFAFDRLTGLVWTTATMSPGPATNPPGCNTGTNLTWVEALAHVACLNTNAYLGRSDWRLPNRKELRSLEDYSGGNPALPVGHPFSDLDGLTYWSSTSDPSAPSEAWTVSMFDGGIGGAVKAATLPAWPVSGPDLVAPALTITQGNMTTKVVSQTISGTVEAGATVTVTNNGTPVTAVVTGTTWNSTIDPLTTGLNNVIASAADFSGNISTAAINITLDAAAPSLSINAVTTPTRVSSQTVSGTVEAGATVTVKLGTTVAPATVTGTTWNSVIPNLVEGANTIIVIAADAAGNTSTLPPVTITLDTILPVTTATPVPGNNFDSVSVTLTASEAGSTIYYTTDGTPVTTASPVYSAPVRLAANTTTPFTLRFMAVDQAGNAEAVKSAAYMIQLGCDLNGDNTVDVRDALKALQISIGLFPATQDEMTRGDVAPLVNGKPKPNGIIDLMDTLVILQRSMGLLSSW